MKLRATTLAAMLLGAAPVIGGYLSVVTVHRTASCVYDTNKAAHQVPPVCTQRAGTALQASLPVTRTPN
jgi:hypothetical protein